MRLALFQPDIAANAGTNPGEIAGNGIDDDNNGYIDDINGWNFWGYRDKKGCTIRSQFEYVRIFKMYNNFFSNKIIEEIHSDSLKIYNNYLKAKERYHKELNKQTVDQPDFIKKLELSYYKQRDTLLSIYPNLTIQIDSLKNIKTENKKVQKKIDNLIYYLSMDIENTLVELKKTNQNYLNYYINIDYNDRLKIGDDVNDLNDMSYGNNVIYFGSLSPSHGTEVSSQIAFIFNRIQNSNLKIMPLVVAVNGNEHDKDIALAIRYAVDNGAHIINTAISKEFSLHNEWVREAIKYAEQHNVLIIKSAGNFGYDVTNQDYFPNDKNSDGTEYVNNFINVGATTQNIDQKLFADYSCYSKTDVDIFAPGSNLVVAMPGNKYDLGSGTSLSAPIVAGIAALLKSYYPDLKAHEIKEILMESGTVIDLEVEIKDDLGNPKLVPFSSLSKSGKIVNAYNALIWAEHYTKEKKRKTK